MVATSLDYGATNTTRYNTLSGPALPNADWSIGGWLRRDRARPAGYYQLLSANVAIGGDNRVTLFHGGSDFVGVGQAQDGAGHASPTLFGSYVDDALNYLIVLQRRGTNLELYTVAKGATASAPNDSGAHGFTTGISAATWYLGARDDLSANFNNQPFGENFCLLSDSLSAAEVTSLAVGVHITSVRPSPAFDLRFRISQATEPDLSGNGRNATQFGSGWATATEFFADGAAAASSAPNRSFNPMLVSM